MLTNYFSVTRYSVTREKYTAEPIRKWREKSGMSCRALARRLGVSAAYLSNIERGLKFMSFQQANRISRELSKIIEADKEAQ